MKIKIDRNLKNNRKDLYDLIIVGGGIYGIMLSLEAVRRNLRPLLLEKSDFINATSLNHLRTVHGGFRYLQTMDIKRFIESVGERKWFLKHFPQFVKPLPCIMPLYGRGIHRNSILRAGLLANDSLSFYRNISIPKDWHLPGGKILSPKKTKEIFPSVDPKGLTGSALWYDATFEENQALMIHLLKIAINSGANALNYMEANTLLKENNQVVGVQAIDQESGEEFDFRAPIVINAAGPWCRELATSLDKDYLHLFNKRLLVWNILFNSEAISNHALALTPNNSSNHTYFFHPWKNRLIVGTGEVIVEKNSSETIVPLKEKENFIKDINASVPNLNIELDDIQRIYSGILPADTNGNMSKREVIIDHSKTMGPKGLFSVSGIKFTTSRLVAEKTLNRIFPKIHKIPHEKIQIPDTNVNLYLDYNWEPDKNEDMDFLKDIISNESVLHLSDLILRRTSLGDNPTRAQKILPKIKSLFNWNDEKWEKEVEDLKNNLSN